MEDKGATACRTRGPKAVDLLPVLAGPEIYRQLVIDARWTHDEHVQWLSDVVLRELFGRRAHA